MNEEFWELLALYHSGEITPAEKARLEQLLLECPDNWLKSGLLEQLSFRLESGLPPEEMERISNKIGQRVEAAMHTSRRKRRYLFTGGAAVLALLAFGYYYLQPVGPTYKQLSAIAGTKTRVSLQDGSSVFLNAGSTLKYPSKFNGRTREIYLSGEGYFDVAPDAARPFIIHTAKMDIRVLGTAFNVRAYEDEAFSETSLISGAVEVTVKEEGQYRKVRLTPSQKLVLHSKALHEQEIDEQQAAPLPKTGKSLHDMDMELDSLAKLDSNLTVETAWMQNKLVFRDETFASLARRLERWYGVKVIIRDPQLATLRFTGQAENISLEKLLLFLQEIQTFNYTAHDNTIIIQ